MNTIRKYGSARTARKQRGFSMAEALIAMAVTAFGLMAVGKFQSVTLLSSGQSKARTEALALAEREIEQLRNYSTLDEFDNQISSSSSQWGGLNAEFTITRTVTFNTSPSYKNLSVTVSWEDQTGPQDVELTSFIKRGDPLNASKIMIASVGGIEYFADDDADEDDSIDYGDDEPAGDDEDGDDDQSDDDDNNGSDDYSDDAVQADTDQSSSDYYNLSISGSITIIGNNTQVTAVSASGNYPMDCVFTNSFYSCESGPIPNGVGWSGSVSIKSNKTVCNNEGEIYYYMVNSNISRSYIIAKNQNSCP